MSPTYASGFWEWRRVESNTYYHFCFTSREIKPSSKLTHPRVWKTYRQLLNVGTNTPGPEPAHRSPVMQQHSWTRHTAAHPRASNCSHHFRCSTPRTDSSAPTTRNSTWNSLDTEQHLHTSPQHNRASGLKCLLIWSWHLWYTLAGSLSTDYPFLSAQWWHFPIHIFCNICFISNMAFLSFQKNIFSCSWLCIHGKEKHKYTVRR